MKKVMSFIVYTIVALIMLIVVINSFCCVSYGPDKPSSGIITYWFMKNILKK